MNPYNYLFYRIYSLALRLKVFDGEFSALMTVSVIIYFNILLILDVSDNEFLLNTKEQAVPASLAVIAINFLYFLRKKRFLKIKERYENESMLQKTIGSLIVIIYVIASFFLPLMID